MELVLELAFVVRAVKILIVVVQVKIVIVVVVVVVVIVKIVIGSRMFTSNVIRGGLVVCPSIRLFIDTCHFLPHHYLDRSSLS